ncbi:MAG TPA: EamA family transporter [Candidatus Dormibacteraeota bacterium]|nr:EamA family transporter [Candidatus Dormibacteraeota bacterium]
MAATPYRRNYKTLLAFAIIYFVWGSTYLAIRIGVHEVPPFLLAAMRFTIAGLVLYFWAWMRGERSPSAREWFSASLLAILIFVIDYGLVFWSEQRVPSGLAAVIMSINAVFMALAEIAILRSQKLTVRLGIALMLGVAGVAMLVSHTLHLGGEPIDTMGAIALLIASLSWSVSSSVTRKLPLPSSKTMSSGVQMLTGGLMLFVIAAALREFRGFHPAQVSRAAWIALLYLIVAGSIVAFTAYVWLIHREAPTKVGTYAYVNPVVAVLLGYFFAGEPLGLRTVLGSVFVLVSVVVITTTPARNPAASLTVDELETTSD